MSTNSVSRRTWNISNMNTKTITPKKKGGIISPSTYRRPRRILMRAESSIQHFQVCQLPCEPRCTFSRGLHNVSSSTAKPHRTWLPLGADESQGTKHRLLQQLLRVLS